MLQHTMILQRFFIILFFIAGSCYGLSSNQKKFLQDLASVENAFDVYYAPKEYKHSLFGWSLEEEVAKARRKIESNPGITTKEFHQILIELCRSCKDYHVDISFYATEYAYLPFNIESAEGRYFFTFVEGNHTFSEGDEIVAINGKSIEEVVENLKHRLFLNNKAKTDQKNAEMFLTLRFGDYGHEVPNTKVEVTAKKRNGDLVSERVKWEYHPEKVLRSFVNKPKRPFIKREWGVKNPFARRMNKSDTSFLGESINWEAGNKSIFKGRILIIDGWRVGTLSICDYMNFSAKNIEDFKKTIQVMEKGTDLLVIDQRNNHGGYPLYLYTLLSMLTDYPLKNLQENIVLCNEIAYEANDIIEEYGYNPSNGILGLQSQIDLFPYKQNAIDNQIKYNKTILNQWTSGNQITSSIPLFGFTEIQPHPEVRYTKPIIVMVNEKCYSCGDLFPVILQENKRAVIFGTETAGAGCCVLAYSFPNHSGIADLKLSISLITKSNGSAVENCGVVPDVLYEKTARDLQERDYDLNQALRKTINAVLGQ